MPKVKVLIENPPNSFDLLKRTGYKRKRKHPSYGRLGSNSLKLTDLPLEILLQIIDRINIWHRNRIRGSCKVLRDACDIMLMHELKSSLRKYKEENKFGYEYNALTTIHHATWAYVKAGYCPLFLGSMLPMMKEHYKDSLVPNVDEIKIFLWKFFGLVGEKLENPLCYKARLLYTITLLGMLNKCKSVKFSPTDVNPEAWKVVYLLDGAWFGTLWSAHQKTFSYLSDGIELIVILTEIIIAIKTRRAFKKVWEIGSKVFVYGYDISQRSKPPRTIFTFHIEGSKDILSFLKNCSRKQNWEPLPTSEFRVSIHIFCEEAAKWGCYKKYDLKVNPSVVL